MERTKIDGSSNIESVGFKNGILEVEFKKGRLIYQYSPVTASMFASLLSSPSKTAWLNSNIKNNKAITYKKL